MKQGGDAALAARCEQRRDHRRSWVAHVEDELDDVVTTQVTHHNYAFVNGEHVHLPR
jgi:hypothetical protein